MTLPTNNVLITESDLATETQLHMASLNSDIQHAARLFTKRHRWVSITDSTPLKDRSVLFFVDDAYTVAMIGIHVYSSTTSARTSTVKLRAVTRAITDFSQAMEDRTLTEELATTATGWDDSRATYQDVTSDIYILRPGVLYELSVEYSDSSGADVHEAHLVLSSRRRRR